MSTEEIEFSPEEFVRKQTEQVLSSGTTHGLGPAPGVVLLTVRGARSGKLRYQLVIRIEKDENYVVVASLAGADKHPAWYYNLLAHPEVHLQDGTRTRAYRAREVTGEEKQPWWDLAVAAFPTYAQYQEQTERQIPVFVLEPTV